MKCFILRKRVVTGDNKKRQQMNGAQIKISEKSISDILNLLKARKLKDSSRSVLQPIPYKELKKQK